MEIVTLKSTHLSHSGHSQPIQYAFNYLGGESEHVDNRLTKSSVVQKVKGVGRIPEWDQDSLDPETD